MKHKQCSHQPCSQHDNPSYTNYQATVSHPEVQIQFRRSFENGILREPVSAAVQCDQWLQDTGRNSFASRAHYMSDPVYRGFGFKPYQEMYMLKMSV
jgi:hypothetical protein